MSRPLSGRLRAWALALSLFIPVVATGVLAYEAIGLDRSHRAIADGVLRDYSAFAADQFARLAAERLTVMARTVLEPVACGTSTSARLAAAHGRLSIARKPTSCDCAPPVAVDAFFEIDPITRRLAFTAGILSPTVQEALARLALDRAVGIVLLSDANRASPLVIGYRSDGAPGANRHIVGFVAPAAVLRHVFDGIVRHERLLPGTLTDTAQNRSLVSIDVRDASHTSIYRLGEQDLSHLAQRPIGSPGANMQVLLGVNAGAAHRLIIGGVPQSRLPMLLSLLALSIGLLSLGAWQVQREHRLARMRVDFVRSASHELRTPLAQIRLFTETLQLGRVRSWTEVVRSLAFVDQQTRRLSGLVENLLTFAHGQRRRAREDDVDLAVFLPELARGFQPIVEALGQKLELVLDESSVVRADREWLTQVLLNLLDNATKYGPAGQTIVIRSVREGEFGRILVDDEGPGVPVNDRQRIFETFVRLSRAHEERTGGTGIGLAVAKELMTTMHGRIWVDALPTGARFVVELPAAHIDTARVA